MYAAFEAGKMANGKKYKFLGRGRGTERSPLPVGAAGHVLMAPWYAAHWAKLTLALQKGGDTQWMPSLFCFCFPSPQQEAKEQQIFKGSNQMRYKDMAQVERLVFILYIYVLYLSLNLLKLSMIRRWGTETWRLTEALFNFTSWKFSSRKLAVEACGLPVASCQLP